MNSKRNVYLDLKPIETASQILTDHFGQVSTRTETLEVTQAMGRVLSEPAFAQLSSPNFHAAAMDGIAVDASVTFGANEDHPIILENEKEMFWVNTGHLLPEGTNAVIMIEHLNRVDDTRVQIEAPAVPWQHVRKMGEDIVATKLLFARGHKIDPYSMGALLSGGIYEVKVHQKPRVLILPTGSELVTWETARAEGLAPGRVIESNSTVLTGLCTACSADPTCREMLRDDPAVISQVVEQACQGNDTTPAYDMVCIIGGSSAGSEDFARPVISSLGEVLVHGVTMMPGKPVIFGKIGTTPVFGIPGYPVSAIVAFEQFVGPLLLSMQNLPPRQDLSEPVRPARKMASKLGQEEFIRVKIGSVDNRLIASPLPRGAGSITTITEADGILRVPANEEGVSESETMQARLLKPLSAIENTVVITGSHDNTLDLLADQVRLNDRAVSISSNHVGSMGGLMAIRKNACHLAGTHLLDPEDGSYNISYVQKYLPDESLVLVHLVMREQGLIVAKNNPKQIHSLADLSEKDFQFINRQAGSGTRVLLDYQLEKMGIAPDTITGYERDEYTHLSVAVAVLSGRADAGLGILAAAKALDLDFIPVVTESYDLVIPQRFFKTAKVQVLMDTIHSSSFQHQVAALGGYSTRESGKILYQS